MVTQIVKALSSVINLLHTTSYILAYKVLKNIAENLNIIPSETSILSSFDPIIPTTQYFIMGTKKTNDFEDLEVAVIAGFIEDLDMISSYDLSKSSATKALIKDSYKMLCKVFFEYFTVKKSYGTSFSCEVSGAMIAVLTRQIISSKEVTVKFIEQNSKKAVIEGLFKIPATIAKNYVIDNSILDEKYIIAEQAYRTIGNTGKYFPNIFSINYSQLKEEFLGMKNPAIMNMSGEHEDF